MISTTSALYDAVASRPLSAPNPPPRLGSRELFPDVQAQAFLNYGAIGPPSRPVLDAVAAAMRDYATRGGGAILTWVGRRNVLRAQLARLIHAPDPSDVALVTSTTQGVIDIAFSLPWRAGDGVVLVRGEFPSNVTPWLQAARHFGLTVHWLDAADLLLPNGRGFVQLEALLSRHRIRILAISSVQFQTGHRMPVAALARLCHRYGAEIFVDAIQSLGIIPMDVTDGPIDYLASGGQKFLMAGFEGTGLLYVRAEHISRLHPRFAGWLSHEDPISFLFEGAGRLRYDRPVRARADLFENGSMNVLGFAALEAAVGLIEDLGVPAIFDHALGYLAKLEAGLATLGLQSCRAAEPGTHSAILSYPCPRALSVPALHQAIARRGVACSTPDGHLRFAPHWPNDPDSEIALVVDAVGAALRELGHDRWPANPSFLPGSSSANGPVQTSSPQHGWTAS